MAIESDGKSPEGLEALPARRMSQPQAMKTDRYVYGVEEMNGFDAWALFEACAQGDVPQVKALLTKDPRLANAQYWYQFPIHMAVRAGHAELVELLLKQGADPGQSRFTYNSWDKLLLCARERGYRRIESILERAMRRRFHYRGDFGVLKEAIIERNPRKVGAVLRRQRALASASDALGNNPLHWSECCLTIGSVYHGDQAKPLQELLRRHGAYTPPYTMDVAQMKAAIRGGHEVVRDEEFLGNLIEKRNAKLLDLYLDVDPNVPELLTSGCRITYPKSPALVRRLFERGLDPNRPDWLGKTFLHACAENGDQSVAAVFLDAGANVNARELEFQGTPLAAAVRSCPAGDDPGKAERAQGIVAFLLKRGAATNLPGDEPWATPLAWARRRGLTEIEAMLREHGAS